ncbi:hypothetical protein P9112_000540 [Eukaryota sp. TZLM1-RC]
MSRSALSQQRLKGWKPRLSFNVIRTYPLVASVICLVISFILLFPSFLMTRVTYRYDDQCSEGSCTVSIPIPKTMSSPIYMYYKLNNFHQNHRRYISSFSRNQLYGNSPSERALESDCQPLYSLNDTPLLPCGLVPNTMFNDSFSLHIEGVPLAIDNDNIIWESEKKRYETNPEFSMDVESPHFISWMKISPFSPVIKLWGVIETSIPMGDLVVEIANNFPNVEGGRKSIVLMERNAIGGNAIPLGILSLISSICCVLMTFYFGLLGSRIETTV